MDENHHMTKKAHGKAHNGRPDGAAFAHTKGFVRRVKNLITRDFFVDEFLKALNEENIALIVREGSVSFVEIKREVPPSYEQLQARVHELEQRLGEDNG